LLSVWSLGSEYLVHLSSYLWHESIKFEIDIRKNRKKKTTKLRDGFLKRQNWKTISSTKKKNKRFKNFFQLGNIDVIRTSGAVFCSFCTNKGIDWSKDKIKVLTKIEIMKRSKEAFTELQCLYFCMI